MQYCNPKFKIGNNRGLIITYYGDGKGKTTAALGLALRASGYGIKTLIVQFIKAEGPPFGKGDWTSGEQIALRLNRYIIIKKFGLGFVGIYGDRKKIEEHRQAAKKALDYTLSEAQSGKYGVIILDEFLNAFEANLINNTSLLKILPLKLKHITLVFTGRPEIKEIVKVSDLVTKFSKIKHPFDKGIKAIRGLDF